MDFYSAWSVLGPVSPSLGKGAPDFSSPLIQTSVTGLEELNASHGKSDVFAEWMDEKFDLSIFDGLEGQLDVLDDLDVMDGDPVALLDNLIDWSSEFMGSGSEIIDKKRELSEQNNLSLSPAISPGNKVPDISFGVLPEFKQESLYRQTSDISSASVTSTGPFHVKNEDVFDASDYVEVVLDSPANTEVNSSISSSPLTPESLVSNSKECLKLEICNLDSTGLDSCTSNTPPLTPVSFVPSAECVETERTVDVESNVTPSCGSFVLASPIECKIVDKSHELSSVSSNKCNSSNTPLLIEGKTDIKFDLQAKKHHTRKRAVPTSDPPVPVEIRRKERKRVQNKDAATRYREKKRRESKAVMDEELTLEKRNKELHNTVDKLSNEISYLKGLLKEAKLRAQSRQKKSSNFNSSVTV